MVQEQVMTISCYETQERGRERGREGEKEREGEKDREREGEREKETKQRVSKKVSSIDWNQTEAQKMILFCRKSRFK